MRDPGSGQVRHASMPRQSHKQGFANTDPSSGRSSSGGGCGLTAPSLRRSPAWRTKSLRTAGGWRPGPRGRPDKGTTRGTKRVCKPHTWRMEARAVVPPCMGTPTVGACTLCQSAPPLSTHPPLQLCPLSPLLRASPALTAPLPHQPPPPNPPTHPALHLLRLRHRHRQLVRAALVQRLQPLLKGLLREAHHSAGGIPCNSDVCVC